MTSVTTTFPAGFGSGDAVPIARRALLAGAAATAVLTGATIAGRAVTPVRRGGSTDGPGPAPGPSTVVPGAAAFVAAVGSTFVIEGGLRGRRLVLEEALDRTAAPRPGEARTTGERFSLLFRGPAGRTLPGHRRVLRHPSLGRVELYLQPVGRGLAGQDYEAVIDHRRPLGR